MLRQSDKMAFVSRIGKNFYKILLSLTGLAIVFYVLIEFRLWSMDWTEYFIKVGKWEEFIFVSLIVALVSLVVLKLYHWHIRAQAGGR